LALYLIKIQLKFFLAEFKPPKLAAQIAVQILVFKTSLSGEIAWWIRIFHLSWVWMSIWVSRVWTGLVNTTLVFCLKSDPVSYYIFSVTSFLKHKTHKFLICVFETIVFWKQEIIFFHCIWKWTKRVKKTKKKAKALKNKWIELNCTVACTSVNPHLISDQRNFMAKYLQIYDKDWI